MEQRELEVSLRADKGKEAARRIRRGGMIPAVLYGRKTETLHLVVKPEDLKKILTTGARENTLIGLKVTGAGGKKVGSHVVMLKDLQVHPLSQSYLQADFYAVAMDEKIEVEVPIHLTGKAEGIPADLALPEPASSELADALFRLEGIRSKLPVHET